MGPLKDLVEWYLGIPEAAAGEGTAWNVRFDTPWPYWMPNWLVLLVVLAAIGFVVGVCSRDAKSASLPMRLGMIVLRLSLLCLLLLIMSGLTLRIDRMGLSTVVVLIDDSASMRFDDQYPQQEIAEKAKELIDAGDFNEATRLNLGKAILTNDDGAFLKRLLRKHKLRVYRFSDSVSAVGSEAVEEDDLDALTPLLLDLSPDGAQTRPGPAVVKILDDLRGTRPSAIVILTDGITTTTEEENLSTVAELAREKLVPIYLVGIGSEEPSRDLHLYDMRADEVAFVREPILFSARLKGYELQGRSVSVSLKEKNSDEVLAVKNVTLEQGSQPVKVELSYTPLKSGEFDYILEATALPQETNVENNSELRHVSVRDEKIKVLLADSYRRWEFWYLKNLLDRDGTIELHTVLQDADPEFASQDETARPINGRFPVSYDALVKYAVVIFGDLDPGYLSASILENLQKFVSEAGGGLIMIAGSQHNPISYRGTPLEALLPITIASTKVPPEDVPIVESFRPRLTLEGQQGTPIFQFADSLQETLEIWDQLPEIRWMVEASELKPGAVVFVEHPERRGVEGNLPLIVMQRFGGGKVLFHATDELWLWRLRREDLYYGRYWIQAIRYLSRSKLLGTEGTAELTTDRLVYQRGDAVQLRLRFLNETLAPVGRSGVAVMVERRGGSSQKVELTRRPHLPMVFEGRLNRATDGAYHAFVVEPSFPKMPPSADFRVEAPLQELQRRRLDRRELSLAAKISRGRSYTLEDVHKLPDQIPAGRPIPLESGEPVSIWNRWELMFLFTILLLAEWILRKRCRLV
ncbi:MAG: VWA domain-containing protein [Planctomycetes bacterium]|nr:VWA domain-containing protein [Planctomycetota bacterium]